MTPCAAAPSGAGMSAFADHVTGSAWLLSLVAIFTPTDIFQDKRFAEAIRDEQSRMRFATSLRRSGRSHFGRGVLILFAILSYFLPTIRAFGFPMFLATGVMAWSLSTSTRLS